ncbi:probable helicase with zinc finger domain [Linepithema humile]|uniref:probable helicase with zinc finger domain n=1 Tax=Linepithema humile TaxID=83485 RepID=UPI00351EF23C
MADTTYNWKTNGKTTPFLTDFPERVRRGWVKSAEPDTIVTCENQSGAYIWMNGSANCRIVDNRGVYEWYFTIIAIGNKQLWNVALLCDDHRANFTLKSVQADGVEIGVTNGQEWYDPDPNKWYSDRKRQYLVRIVFTAGKHGAYRQKIIFGFGHCPVLLQSICADYLPNIADYARIQEATSYWLSLMPPRLPNPREFHSAIVPRPEPREIILSKIYPLPNMNNFFLTQDTLSDSKLTPQNYRGRMHEMITLEEISRSEQLSRHNETTLLRISSNYVLVNIDGSTVAKYTPSGELFGQLHLKRDILEDTQSGRLIQRSCNSVLLKVTHNSQEHAVFEAHIEDKGLNFVMLRLSSDCVRSCNLEINSEREVEVQFVLNRLNFCEWHLAIDSLEDVNLVFLNDEHCQFEAQILGNFLQIDANNLSILLSNLLLNSRFNEEQKKAVTAMTLTNKTPSPVLLLGPFGTGKTYTIAHVLRMLVQNPDNRILLCTHSNSAADLYIKEFFDVWYKRDKHPRLKPIRIYYRLRALNTVHPVVQEYCLMDEYGRFRNPVERDLEDHGLIVTTLATSSCLHNLNLSPTHIVIDEAAQAIECEALIALNLAKSKTRMILAGDQMQLAPEIYNMLANERGLGISLLQRMCDLYPLHHPFRIHLCQNYRAHADIIKYMSEAFYDGIVKPANTQLRRHPTMKPLMFYATYGAENTGIHSTGYFHIMEAEELANRVLELKNMWPTEHWGPYDEGSIGVVAYYPEQVTLLRVELRKRHLFDVSVERVLNVQGKQFTAVFISTVRTRTVDRFSAETKIKDYGFLTNPRLLNTAMTRAKCLVAVFGDPVALLTIGSCRELWRKYIEVADLHGMTRKNLQEHLNQIPQLKLQPLNPDAAVFYPRLLRYITYVEGPTAQTTPTIPMLYYRTQSDKPEQC